MKPDIARKLLNVSKTCTQKEIKIAWKRKMKKYHPDIYKNSKKNESYCKQLNEAKFTLLENFVEISETQRKSIYYPFDSVAEEYEFWEKIMNNEK